MKTIKTIFLTALILTFCSNLFAQERTVDGKEFETIFQNSFEKLKGKSYRVTIKSREKSKTSSSVYTDADISRNFYRRENLSVNYNSNDLFRNFSMNTNTSGFWSFDSSLPNISNENRQSVISSKTTIETSADGDSHLTRESTFGNRPQTIKTETIKLNGKVFMRSAGGGWRESRSGNLPNSPSSVKTVKLPVESEYKFLGTDRLKDQNADLYLVSEKRNLTDVLTSISRTKYWFTDDGRLLKKETELEVLIAGDGGSAIAAKHPVLNKTSEVIRKRVFEAASTTVYELDSDIKIEEPIK